MTNPRTPSNADRASGGNWVLGVLLAVNLLNYLDRYVVSAVLPLIKSDLGVSDAKLGALASAFMIVYMCAAVPIGYLADRFSRKAWITGGIIFWSLATFASGLATSYRQLFSTRAAVGIGESCYGSLSPSFVAEHFPENRRARALAIFAMAVPVGSALGFVIGGVLGERWGWRQAFFAAGLPGLLLAWPAHRLKDPRLAPTKTAGGAAPESSAPAPHPVDYLRLGRNRSLVLCTLGMAAMTFALGAFAIWMPTFYVRLWRMDLARANLIFGAITVAAGTIGSLAGGWIADRVRNVRSTAYFLVSGTGLILAFPISLAAILSSGAGSLVALFLTEFFAFLNMGPLNAVIVSVTPARVRSMAFAANIFVIHALGDAVSPALIGRLSDLYGLRSALAAAAVMLAAGGLFCLWGAEYYDEDARRANA